MKQKPQEHIWVIGASSGIGRALATQYAEAGHVVALSARRKDALEELNQTLGGNHHVVPCDVSDAEQMVQAAKQVQTSLKHVDRIIFLAALYQPQSIADMDMGQMSKLVDVNLKGVMHTAHAVIPLLLSQGEGQLALCGSVAGYRGLPNAQPYGATKAAVINFAESLRAEMGEQFDVRVINPGFVDTPLTEKNDFDMPMMISAKEAAASIIKGLQSSHFEVHFPKRFTCQLKFLRWLPEPIYTAIVRKLV